MDSSLCSYKTKTQSTYPDDANIIFFSSLKHKENYVVEWGKFVTNHGVRICRVPNKIDNFLLCCNSDDLQMYCQTIEPRVYTMKLMEIPRQQTNSYATHAIQNEKEMKKKNSTSP